MELPRSKYLDVCAVCGRKSGEHHNFIPTIVTMPLTCKCHPYAWPDSNNIPAVCGSFKDGPVICKKCQHMEECHAGEKP